MSDLFQSSIKELRGSTLDNMHLLIQRINDCYSLLVDSQISIFFSTVCNDFFQAWSPPEASNINFEHLVGWLSFEMDLQRLLYPLSAEDNLNQFEQLMNHMLSTLFTCLTSFQTNLVAIETIGNAQVRLMFIAELFIVPLREIHGHVYHRNLQCGSKACDKHIIDAINQMHTITPAPIAKLNDYRFVGCLQKDSLREFAHRWGVFRTLTPKYSEMTFDQRETFHESIRETLYILLGIYQKVARKYSLELKQLTNYLLEKKKRNETAHYGEAIKKYAKNLTPNKFSLNDFVQIPENKHITSAIAQENQQLREIFEGACHLQQRFPYDM